MSRTARAAWKRLRVSILERDGWRCTRCGKSGQLEVTTSCQWTRAARTRRATFGPCAVDAT